MGTEQQILEEAPERSTASFFRFPPGTGLSSLHKSIPGRAIILLVIGNIVWWFVALEVIRHEAGDEAVGTAIASAVCLGASLFLLAYIFVAGNAQVPRWAYLSVSLLGLALVYLVSFSLTDGFPEDLAPALSSWPLFSLLFSPFLYRSPYFGSRRASAKPFKKPSAWSYVVAWVVAGMIAGVLGGVAVAVVMSSADPPRLRSEWVEYWTPYFALGSALATVGGILSQALVYGLFRTLRPSPVIPWMLVLGLLGVGYNYTQTHSILQSNGWSAHDANAMASISSACVFLGLLVQTAAFWFIFKHREHLHTKLEAAIAAVRLSPPIQE